MLPKALLLPLLLLLHLPWQWHLWRSHDGEMLAVPRQQLLWLHSKLLLLLLLAVPWQLLLLLHSSMLLLLLLPMPLCMLLRRLEGMHGVVHALLCLLLLMATANDRLAAQTTRRAEHLVLLGRLHFGPNFKSIAV